VKAKTLGASQSDATDDLKLWLDKFSLKLGTWPAGLHERLKFIDIDEILNEADASDRGTMPYEADAITGALTPGHALKAGIVPGTVAKKTTVTDLLAKDSALIKKYDETIALAPGNERELLHEIVINRCYVAHLIARLYGDATYRMQASIVHPHLINVRIALDRLQRINGMGKAARATNAELIKSQTEYLHSALGTAKTRAISLRTGVHASEAASSGAASGADAAVAAANAAAEELVSKIPNKVYKASIKR
jgi:hypothetical protein